MSRHFISYSSADALEFARRLCAELEGGEPPHPVWLDRRDIRPGQDWDEAIAEAVKTCLSLLFVMTPDSVEDCSECKREWSYALRYKKPVIPLKLDPEAETPFRLGTRQHIDFTRAPAADDGFGPSLARLREHLAWLGSPSAPATCPPRAAFTHALAEADVLLARNVHNYCALDTRALALSGLAAGGEPARASEAAEAYRAARSVNKGAGTVTWSLRLFDELARADAGDVLAGVREAVRGD